MPAGSGGRVLTRQLPWARFLVVLVLIALDLFTKQAAFAWMEGPPVPDGLTIDDHGHRRVPVLGNWLAVMLSLNPGAAWGQLSDYPFLLIGGRILAGLVLTVLVWRAERGRWVVLTALVLILSGAMGNLYDNLVLEPPSDHPFGEVRDFIDVYFARWDWHFPTFNVADSCISVGAALLLLSSFGSSDAEEPAEPAPEADAA